MRKKIRISENELIELIKKVLSEDELDKGKRKKNNSTTNYKYSPRIDAELDYIKGRYERREQTKKETPYWLKSHELPGFGKPFFIYDSKFNLLYLFDEKYNYVAHTSVVDGADLKRNTEPVTFSYTEWCKASGFKDRPYICTDPTTGKKVGPDYNKLIELKDRFLPQGIYTITSMRRQPGYTGKGLNQYNLSKKEGGEIGQAIHGIPDTGRRLEMSAVLEKNLKNAVNSSQVPPEYLEDIKDILNANLSSGCVGIPAKFVENPDVVAKVQVGCAVFVIGEEDENYLVKNSDEFFDKLSGDGINCKNPYSLAKEMGTSI